MTGGGDWEDCLDKNKFLTSSADTCAKSGTLLAPQNSTGPTWRLTQERRLVSHLLGGPL